MKNGRKSFSLFRILFAALCLLSGCASNARPESQSLPTQPEKVQSNVTAPVHVAVGEGGVGPYVSSENGFYELKSVSANSYNIFFTDYVSNQQVYLCAQPNCAHNSESCTSYVDASRGNVPGLLYDDKKLYLISPASPDEAYLPVIEVMEPDGTDRTVLAQFSATKNLNNGVFAADQNALYFVMNDVQTDGQAKKYVCAVDKKNGSERIVWEIPDKTSFWILGAYDRFLLAKTIDDENMHHLMRINLDAPEEQEEVAVWRISKQFGLVCQSRLYLYDFETEKFSVQDFQTGEIKELSNAGGFAFEKFYNVAEVDGKAVITADVQTGAGTKVSNFFLDFELSQVKELGLLDNMEHPVTICGTYGDNVYVINQYSMQSVAVEMNGVAGSVQLPVGQCAYLPKVDFFAGKPNYTPCAPLA